VGYWCPQCGEEQISITFTIVGQGMCPMCDEIITLMNVLMNFDEALERRREYEKTFGDLPI